MRKFVYYAIFLIAALVVGFHEYDSQEVNPVRYTIVTVERGDTVWSIATKYSTHSQDIRHVIAVMKEVNNLNRSVDIYPGQTLRVPVVERPSLELATVRTAH